MPRNQKNRKIIAASVGVFLFCFMFTVSLGFSENNANSNFPQLSIESPINGAILRDNNETVKYSVNLPDQISYYSFLPLDFYVDGQLRTQIILNNINCKHNPGEWSLSLSNLAQGNHTIQIKALLTSMPAAGVIIKDEISSTPIDFYVNHRILPNVRVLSQDQTTFFAIVEVNNNLLTYSLDSQANVTLPPQSDNTYNITLTNLTNGNHVITVYAKDQFGNVGSAQTAFITNNADTTATAKPTVPYSVSAVFVGGIISGIIIACAVALLFYRKIRGGKNQP
jgi:hypothetical protein